jgi:hypothetical protein
MREMRGLMMIVLIEQLRGPTDDEGLDEEGA